MPLGSLLPNRTRTDPARQLKEYLTVIENEQDKDKKNYEEVNVSFQKLKFNSYSIVFLLLLLSH